MLNPIIKKRNKQSPKGKFCKKYEKKVENSGDYLYNKGMIHFWQKVGGLCKLRKIFDWDKVKPFSIQLSEDEFDKIEKMRGCRQNPIKYQVLVC